MLDYHGRHTRRLGLLGVALLALAGIAGTAIAGHDPGSVKSYTGCLVSKDGVIIKIKEGAAPSSPCTGGMVQVHFGGGDITQISVSGGLTGGGDSGHVTISLDPKFSLPQNCSSQQVAKWNGSAWVCAAENDTTYTAGTGLQLSGTEFSIHPNYRVKNEPDCPSGQFVKGIDASGVVQCVTPPAAGGVQAYFAHVGVVHLGGTTTVLSKVLPPGKYVLSASVELVNEDDEDTAVGGCSIPGYTTGDSNIFAVPAAELGSQSSSGSVESLSLTSAITHEGGPIELKCTEYEADVNVHQAGLTAIKVDSLG